MEVNFFLSEIDSLIQKLKDKDTVLENSELIDNLIVFQLQKIKCEDKPEYNLTPCSEKAMENLTCLLKIKCEIKD